MTLSSLDLPRGAARSSARTTSAASKRFLALGLSATLATAALALSAPALASAEPNPNLQTQVFTDPAGTSFVVPSGVRSVFAVVAGSNGGGAVAPGTEFVQPGGFGSVITASYDVVPGETLQVFGSTNGNDAVSPSANLPVPTLQADQNLESIEGDVFTEGTLETLVVEQGADVSFQIADDAAPIAAANHGLGYREGGQGAAIDGTDYLAGGGGGASAIVRNSEPVVVAAGGGGATLALTTDPAVGLGAGPGLGADDPNFPAPFANGHGQNGGQIAFPAGTFNLESTFHVLGGGGGAGFFGGNGGYVAGLSDDGTPSNENLFSTGGDSLVPENASLFSLQNSGVEPGSVTLMWETPPASTTTINAPATVKTFTWFDLTVDVTGEVIEETPVETEVPVETETPVETEVPEETPIETEPPLQLLAVDTAPEGRVVLFGNGVEIGSTDVVNGVADFSNAIQFGVAGLVELRAVFEPSEVSPFSASEAVTEILVTEDAVIPGPGESEVPVESETPVVPETPVDTPAASTPGVTAPAVTQAPGAANLPQTGMGAELGALLIGAALLVLFGAAVRMRAAAKHAS
ncbi:hypothetical protein [Humidisolicoccus flavus]|uniref:hypothetical protein n=1 Tax=Humidisolicoccus flavus TaxID=3111414 RepID=UPI003246FC2A